MKSTFLGLLLLTAITAFAQSGQDSVTNTSPSKIPGRKSTAASAKSANSSSKKAMADMKDEKHSYTPDEVNWGPVPPFIPEGAKLAVLEGNPMASTGDYTVRLKMPDGYKIPPHWHPKRENVTVLTGTLGFAMGEKFDESQLKDFGAGSFAYLDPNMHHYVMARGETIVQVHGQSPLNFNYINPEDDPSKKK